MSRFYSNMTIINDATTSLNKLNLSYTNEKDMEIDHLPMRNTNATPTKPEIFDEMDVPISEGERQMYEIYVENLTDNADEMMETYLSIMSDVVGGHENAIAILASNLNDMNCFVVSLTRFELEKLVEMDNEKIRGIYPPYKPV